MKKILGFVFIVGVLSHLVAFGLDEVTKNLVSQHIKGNFIGEQESQDLGFSLPIYGSFELKSPTLLLDLKSPIALGLWIKDSGFYIKMSQGWQRSPFDLDEKLILDVLYARLNRLERDFILNFKGTAQSWELTLLPKQTALKNKLKEIRIDGGAFIRSVFVWEKNGNKWRIRFQNIKTIPE